MHNHPSGDPKPSRGDIEMTRDIKAAYDPKRKWRTRLLDHLVGTGARLCIAISAMMLSSAVAIR
jgi:DNA repair protein RadC